MPIVKVFFGMSVRRAEEEQPQAVAEVERSGLETENSEDVHVGKRRTTRRQVAGGKSRLRRRFGGRQKISEEGVDVGKEVESAEAQKAKKDAKEIQNKGEASEIVAGKRERSASRRSSSGRSKSDESRKGKRSVSFRRSKSEGRKFLKPKMTKEEKQAKKLARQEAKETAKTFKTAPETSEERPEILDFTLAPMTKALAIKLRRDERKLKRQAVKKALKDPNRIRLGTFQYGKLVNVPAAFRDMRKRAGRR
ncbi:Protein CBG26540 [Caenorhabditis briggsae]|uniref:Protein CBG26540 n=1 Tax=Caenorhabditis briggsae TaxID=6238 RepID=B6IIX1_CAEBR|nr:Protein CBG26540 [Caenorhabditis briggsae]CAR99851.1 Protein CBG26540 [Caenorhabditis briggsae]